MARFELSLFFVPAVLLGAATASAVPFHKEFIVDGVAAGAKMQAGGWGDTWQKLPLVPKGKVKVLEKPLVEFTDTHCKNNTAIKSFGGGAVGVDVDTQQPGAAAGLAFHDEALANDGVNKGRATVDIHLRNVAPGPRSVDVKNPGAPAKRVALSNEVRAVLDGEAIAKQPTKPNTCNSAFAAAAVDITGTDRFRVLTPGAIPAVNRLGKTDLLSGGADIVFQDKAVENRDPYFMTVTDLDTGVATTEVIMRQDIDSFNAFFSIDDTGIRLAIDRNDPGSFVSLTFVTDSPWVTNPYSYAARLDSAGLTASGETPLSGWSVTTTAEMIEAFFGFGPNGQPYDMVTVRPPDSLFTVGHEYRYDATVGDAANEVVVAPEPPALPLLGVGLLLMLLHRGRRDPASGQNGTPMRTGT